MELNNMSCCAVGEIHDLRDDDNPEDTLKQLAGEYFDTRYDGRWADGGRAFIVFTEVCKSEDGTHGTYGKVLKEYIEDNKLGTVINTGQALNPNHSESGGKHWVKVYVWTVSRRSFKKWAKDNECLPEPYSEVSTARINGWEYW